MSIFRRTTSSSSSSPAHAQLPASASSQHQHAHAEEYRVRVSWEPEEENGGRRIEDRVVRFGSSKGKALSSLLEQLGVLEPKKTVVLVRRTDHEEAVLVKDADVEKVDDNCTIVVGSKKAFDRLNQERERMYHGELKRSDSAERLNLATSVKRGEGDRAVAFVRLIIHGATDLAAMDLTGKSDPFVLCRMHGSGYITKTETKFKTLSPAWEQPMLLPLRSLAQPMLLVACFDFDVGSSPDFIGASCIELRQGKVDYEWHRIEVGLAKHTQKGTKQRGRLRLSYQFINIAEAERKLFGATLPDALIRGDTELEVPLIVKDCCQQIVERGLDLEGIGRLSGASTEIADLRAQYDKGDEVNLAQTSPHTVMGLLKLYLRELPDPLLTRKLWPAFVDASSKAVGEISTLLPILMQLPPENKRLLLALMDLFRSISSKSNVNKMTSENIAIVFAPNMAPVDNDPSPQAILAQAHATNEVVKTLAAHHDAVVAALKPQTRNLLGAIDSLAVTAGSTLPPPLT